MSVIKFELKEDHIKLIRQLKWHTNQDEVIQSCLKDDDDVTSKSPFGGDSLIEDLGTIIYGKTEDFDPFESEELRYSEEQRDELMGLYEDLPMALEIVLQTGEFKEGNFKTKFHDRNWKTYK